MKTFLNIYHLSSLMLHRKKPLLHTCRGTSDITETNCNCNRLFLKLSPTKQKVVLLHLMELLCDKLSKHV